MASSIKAAVKDVLLIDQNTWEAWYQNIKGSVQDYLWNYFNPDSTTVFVRPIELLKPVFDILQENPAVSSSGPNTRSTSLQSLGETSEQRAAREAKFDKEFDWYTEHHQIWRNAKKDWETFHTAQLKLQEKILVTVGK